MSIKIFFKGLLCIFLIAITPILLAMGSWILSGFQGDILSEGGEGHGVYLWLFLYSIPIGSFLFGLLILILAILWIRKYLANN